MKNLLFLFFISFAANAYGQNDFLGNTAQGGNITFNCSQKSGNTIIVYNQQTGLLPHDFSPNKGGDCLKAMITQTAYNNMYAAARQVFSQTRANQLAAGKPIRIYANVTPQGQILGVIYRLDNATEITPTELANLDNALRQIAFPLDNATFCTHVGHLPYQGQIHFNKLYQ